MAEIFGAAAAALGVLEVGLKASSRLRVVIKTWKNVPQELASLSNELSDTTLLLNLTRNAVRRWSADDVCFEVEENIVGQLDRTKDALSDLEKQIKELYSVEEWKRKRKWIRLKPTIYQKRDELRDCRARIGVFLQSCDMYVRSPANYLNWSFAKSCEEFQVHALAWS
jgi:hypothetical protein